MMKKSWSGTLARVFENAAGKGGDAFSEMNEGILELLVVIVGYGGKFGEYNGWAYCVER